MGLRPEKIFYSFQREYRRQLLALPFVLQTNKICKRKKALNWHTFIQVVHNMQLEIVANSAVPL